MSEFELNAYAAKLNIYKYFIGTAHGCACWRGTPCEVVGSVLLSRLWSPLLFGFIAVAAIQQLASSSSKPPPFAHAIHIGAVRPIRDSLPVPAGTGHLSTRWSSPFICFAAKHLLHPVVEPGGCTRLSSVLRVNLQPHAARRWRKAGAFA